MYNKQLIVDGITVYGFKKAKSYGCKRQSYDSELDDESFNSKDNFFDFYSVKDCRWEQASYYGGYSITTTHIPLPKDDAKPIEYVGRIYYNAVVIKHTDKTYRVLVAEDKMHYYGIKWGAFWDTKPTPKQLQWRKTTPVAFMSKGYAMIRKNDDGKWEFIDDMETYKAELDKWEERLNRDPAERDVVIQEYEEDLALVERYELDLQRFITKGENLELKQIYSGVSSYKFLEAQRHIRDMKRRCREGIESAKHQKKIISLYQNEEITKTDAIRNYYKWTDKTLKERIEGEKDE